VQTKHSRFRAAPRQKHDRVIFDLDDGRQRCAQRHPQIRADVTWCRTWTPSPARSGRNRSKFFRAFTLPQFRAHDQIHFRRHQPLCSISTFVAGVGNIYADEITVVRPASSTAPRPIRLKRTPRSPRCTDRSGACSTGLSADRGTDAGDGIIEGNYRPRVYGREDRPCYRCHQPFTRPWSGSAALIICPNCAGKQAKS